MKKLDLNKLRLILAFALIGLVAILLCITPTRDFLVGVFGYAIFAYLVAILIATVLMACGKEIIVSKKREIIYFLLFACFLITIHIATNKAALLDGGYEAYLWATRRRRILTVRLPMTVPAISRKNSGSPCLNWGHHPNILPRRRVSMARATRYRRRAVHRRRSFRLRGDLSRPGCAMPPSSVALTGAAVLR